jgi:hypothetical protein
MEELVGIETEDLGLGLTEAALTSAVSGSAEVAGSSSTDASESVSFE